MATIIGRNIRYGANKFSRPASYGGRLPVGGRLYSSEPNQSKFEQKLEGVEKKPITRVMAIASSYFTVITAVVGIGGGWMTANSVDTDIVTLTSSTDTLGTELKSEVGKANDKLNVILKILSGDGSAPGPSAPPATNTTPAPPATNTPPAP